MKHTHYHSESGVGLLGQAIAVTVLAIIAISLFTLMSHYTSLIKNTNTRIGIADVEKVIMAYGDENNYYPCPANITLKADDPNFGAPNCSISGNPIVGMIPFKELGLSPESAIDSFGYRMTYAVTRAAAGPTGVKNTATPNISILDSNSSLGNALFIIVSHGKNHNGAYSGAGDYTTAPDCDPAETDHENCDGDGTFIQTLETSTTAGNKYDDIMAYRGIWNGPDLECIVVPPSMDTTTYTDIPYVGTTGAGSEGPYPIHYVSGSCPSDWTLIDTFPSPYPGPGFNRRTQVTFKTNLRCEAKSACMSSVGGKNCRPPPWQNYCTIGAVGHGSSSDTNAVTECIAGTMNFSCLDDWQTSTFHVDSTYGIGATVGGTPPDYAICCR